MTSIILRGEKVNLRPMTLADAPRYVGWFADRQVTCFLEMREISLADEQKWIKSILSRSNKTEKVFAIETKDHVHIGSTALHLESKYNNSGFGIFIGDKAFWNRGFGTDAIITILRWGFETMKIRRIWMRAFAKNDRALHVYKKIGFRIEGMERERVFRDGEYQNEVLLAMLKSEWTAKYGKNK